MSKLRNSLLLLTLFASTNFEVVASASTFTKDIQKFVREYADLNSLSGNLFIIESGRSYSMSFGFAIDKQQKQNRASTRFIIGSTSKQFIATAIMRLVDNGLLSVDTPLSQIIEEYPKKNLTGTTGNAVTVRHLMMHTSGIPDAYESPRVAKKLYKSTIHIRDILNAVKNRPLLTEPGAVFKYSNTGYILLGEVIRRVSGRSISDFMNANFFNPLQFRETTVGLPSNRLSMAESYVRDGDTRSSYIELNKIKNIHMDEHFTDGNIVTTARELATWVQLLGSGKLLSARSTAEMFGLELFAPERRHSIDLAPQYTYGWFVHNNLNGHKVYEHSGEWLAFQSSIRYYPNKDLTIVFVSNQALPQNFHTFLDTLAGNSFLFR